MNYELYTLDSGVDAELRLVASGSQDAVLAVSRGYRATPGVAWTVRAEQPQGYDGDDDEDYYSPSLPFDRRELQLPRQYELYRDEGRGFSGKSLAVCTSEEARRAARKLLGPDARYRA